MNEKQILKLAEIILVELQKRNGIRIYNDDNVTINYNRGIIFTTYQLYFSIALILKSFHSIPQNYLRYYIKHTSIKNVVSPTEKQLRVINEILKNFKNRKTFMAGGSLAETFLINKKGQNIIIKKAIGLSSQKLSNELDFLIKLSNNPEIAAHIPEVLDFKRKDGFVSIYLKYYPATTLAYKILFNNINKEEAWEKIEEILEFVMLNIWSKERSDKTENYINGFFLQRIKKNINLLLERAPVLSQLVKAEKVIINGSKYLNLLKIIDIVENDDKLIKILTPPFLCNIWGDLHLNNILLTEDNFILIDPRGDVGDPIYDIGKMYHTLGPGRYDFIDNDLYNITLENNKGIPTIKRKFLTKHPAWTTYNFLCKKFNNKIDKLILPGDHFWKLRWDFINFCIYSTMPPFLIGHESKEERAIMGYSNALIFGKKFLNSLNKK